MQFWSEIKFMSTNRTPNAWSCDLVIMRLISEQEAALRSVQLELLIRCPRAYQNTQTRLLIYSTLQSLQEHIECYNFIDRNTTETSLLPNDGIYHRIYLPYW